MRLPDARLILLVWLRIGAGFLGCGIDMNQNIGLAGHGASLNTLIVRIDVGGAGIDAIDCD